MEKSQQTSNTDKNQNTSKSKKSGDLGDLFKGRFNKKVTFKGTTDWFHDPSGEELEIIEE